VLSNPSVLVLAACELEACSGRSYIWRAAHCSSSRYPSPDAHDSRLTAHNTGKGAPERRQIAPVWAEARGGGVARLPRSPRRQFLASGASPLLFLPGARRAALLTKLSSVVEVTALLRPRLLLVASVAKGQLMLGMLYHTRKDAFQSRLHVRSSAHRAFSQRSRWKKYASAHALERQKQKMVKDFAELAVTLGAAATLHFEFLPQASDAEILQPLSGLLPVLLS
jgi:hypothetical protein